MKYPPRYAATSFTLAAALFAGVVSPAVVAEAATAPGPAPAGEANVVEDHPPIVALDEVRPGMKGYGLTVFRGTEIEAFRVEVLSVIHMSQPQRSIVWVESDDERLRHSGAAQGMSGSPIYLWTDDEAETHEPGEGGRLLGAFAFGYAMNKDPMIGVQPAVYMRRVGEAIDGRGAGRRLADHRGAGLHGRRTLQQLEQMARQRNTSALGRLQLDAARSLLIDGPEAGDALGEARQGSAPGALPTDGDGGDVRPLLLPLSVGSPEVASLLRPLLEPLGLAAVASGGPAPASRFSPVAGPPPEGVNIDELTLEPGGVLSVPLIWGNVDWAIAGTVTEVLDDGTVLAFGHPMLGEGVTAMPMATGHVHFIVPRLNISFKVSGSLAVQGAILADEMAGIAGRMGESSLDSFASAPVSIDVQLPGSEPHTFNYHVVDHPLLTPTLATMAAIESLLAQHDLPVEHTLHLAGQLDFSDGHSLELDSMMVGEGAFGIMLEMIPPVATMTQNPWQNLHLTGVSLRAEVVPEMQVAQIVGARLDRDRLEPGETVGVTVWIEPWGRPIEQVRTQITIPSNVPDGDYRLSVSGASRYVQALNRARPHRQHVRSIDDLREAVQQTMSVNRSAMYLTMELPQQGVAVGRRELAHLPSSRQAMIHRPTTTVATPFNQLLEQVVPMDVAIEGERSFAVHVREERGRSR